MNNKPDYKRIFLFVFILITSFLLVLTYSYINNKYNIGFSCALNEVFGIYCPGCGTTRALMSLLRLDIYQAFRYNAFSIIILPAVGILYIIFIYELVFNKTVDILKKVPIKVWIILGSLFFIYGVIRNFITYLAPTTL